MLVRGVLHTPWLHMSFVLPGNSRQLRFTGEAKAHTPATSEPRNGALALGKPRVRKPPPPPPAAHVQTPVPAPARVQTPAPTFAAPTKVSTPVPERRQRTPVRRDPHRNEVVPSPYLGAINPPVMHHGHDDDDDNPTMAMDRDGLDVLPGARALRTPKPSPAPGAVPPIPHFRPANPTPPPQTVIVPGTASNQPRRTTAAAPLAVWIFAGLLAGIISYHVAPDILMRADHQAPTSQPR